MLIDKLFFSIVFLSKFKILAGLVVNKEIALCKSMILLLLNGIKTTYRKSIIKKNKLK